MLKVLLRPSSDSCAPECCNIVYIIIIWYGVFSRPSVVVVVVIRLLFFCRGKEYLLQLCSRVYSICICLIFVHELNFFYQSEYKCRRDRMKEDKLQS